VLPGWQVEWEAWCVWDGATGRFETGWYPAATEAHARQLSTGGRIRTRITYPPTPWTEQ
jgi:hypothetical protein